MVTMVTIGDMWQPWQPTQVEQHEMPGNVWSKRPRLPGGPTRCQELHPLLYIPLLFVYVTYGDTSLSGCGQVLATPTHGVYGPRVNRL